MNQWRKKEMAIELYEKQLNEVIAQLPEDKVIEVLDFAKFLRWQNKIVEEEGEVFLKPATIGEEEDFLTSQEWDKLDALVENQLQRGEYTEYKSLAEAKGHSRRQQDTL
jgi:hypothetical protein